MHLVDPERPTEHSVFNVPAGNLSRGLGLIYLVLHCWCWRRPLKAEYSLIALLVDVIG